MRKLYKIWLQIRVLPSYQYVKYALGQNLTFVSPLILDNHDETILEYLQGKI